MTDDEWTDDSREPVCTDPDCWCRYPAPPDPTPAQARNRFIFTGGDPAINGTWEPLSDPDDGRPWTARPITTSEFSFTLTRPVTEDDLDWMSVLFGRALINAATRALAAQWLTRPTRQPFPWQPTIDVDADPDHDRTIVPVFAPLRPARDPKFFGIPVIVDPSMPVDSIRFRRNPR